MFKFSPIHTYALRNLQKNQIFFNNPLRFNDPFDTFHPAKITEITNEKFVDLYCQSTKRNFDKEKLLGILENNISKKDFYDFCDKHVEYLFDFKNPNNNQILKSKDDFLEYIKGHPIKVTSILHEHSKQYILGLEQILVTSKLYVLL